MGELGHKKQFFFCGKFILHLKIYFNFAFCSSTEQNVNFALQRSLKDIKVNEKILRVQLDVCICFNGIICFNYNQETSIFLLACYHGPQDQRSILFQLLLLELKGNVKGEN